MISMLRTNGQYYLLICILGILILSSHAMATDHQGNISSIIFTTPTPGLSSPEKNHDYVLESVSLVGDYTTTRAGRTLTARIVVRNQGGDDMAEGDVPVEAWLGDTMLIPVSNTFPPLKRGTAAMFTLRYMIPHDIPTIPCHLTIKVDPWNTRNESGEGINEQTTPALVIIDDKNRDDI